MRRAPFSPLIFLELPSLAWLVKHHYYKPNQSYHIFVLIEISKAYFEGGNKKKKLYLIPKWFFKMMSILECKIKLLSNEFQPATTCCPSATCEYWGLDTSFEVEHWIWSPKTRVPVPVAQGYPEYHLMLLDFSLFLCEKAMIQDHTVSQPWDLDPVRHCMCIRC